MAVPAILRLIVVILRLLARNGVQASVERQVRTDQAGQLRLQVVQLRLLAVIVTTEMLRMQYRLEQVLDVAVDAQG